jgi:hypothetical protein
MPRTQNSSGLNSHRKIVDRDRHPVAVLVNIEVSFRLY